MVSVTAEEWQEDRLTEREKVRRKCESSSQQHRESVKEATPQWLTDRHRESLTKGLATSDTGLQQSGTQIGQISILLYRMFSFRHTAGKNMVLYSIWSLKSHLNVHPVFVDVALWSEAGLGSDQSP